MNASKNTIYKMDEIKKSIRPKLNLQKALTEVEQFQNEVLRPILKLQHDILLRVFILFGKKQKTDVSQLSEERFYEFVKKITDKNTIFRSQLIGIVIGQFTTDEFDQYSKNTSEFNKRIINIAKKRFEDSVEELKTL